MMQTLETYTTEQEIVDEAVRTITAEIGEGNLTVYHRAVIVREVQEAVRKAALLANQRALA